LGMAINNGSMTV